MVFSAAMVYFVLGVAGMIAHHAEVGIKIPHCIACPPDITCIGICSMNDPGVVQRVIIGLKFKPDSFVLIDGSIGYFFGKYLIISINFIII